MRTETISKVRVWQCVNRNLEVWECVKLEDQRKEDAVALAYVCERIKESNKESYFTYEVGNVIGWEMRRNEAMKKAEKIIEGAMTKQPKSSPKAAKS